MTINPYSSIFAIIIFCLILLPGVILGLCEKKIKYYALLANFLVLVLMTRGKSLCVFAGCLLAEYVLLFIYHRFHDKCGGWLYLLTFVLSTIPLVYVKLAAKFHWPLVAIISLSYVCFRIWQLIIEIHDNHIEKFDFINILNFLFFFPCLTSGPIDRYHRFADDCDRHISRREYLDDYLLVGLQKLGLGIIYKFGFAALVNLYWLTKISKTLTIGHATQYMYAYTLYLFFDFAGYSLLAIGTGYILGIKVPENFNLPFLSKNMKEFWERWHISLSKWFGDYLFSRFVLNAVRNKWIINQNAAVRTGYMVTMMTMGIWHGLTGYYLLYGVYQGVMLALSDWLVKLKWYRRHFRCTWYIWLSRLITFHIVAFGMLIFSGYLIRV